MANWTKNNLAHRRTYLSLRILAETNRSFANAGKQKISTLDFWGRGDSKKIRAAKARTLAVRLNNMFRVAFKSKYESGFNKAKSVTVITNVLVDGDNQILRLADAADTCYDFFGEAP